MKTKTKKRTDVRTLELSHEKISHLKNAIAIAELHYADTYKTLCKTKNVRSNELSHKQEEGVVRFYWEKSCLFADLNSKLENGEFDV